MSLGSAITVLLVDDDEGHRELVRRNLRRAGIENRIDTVENGSDALDYVLGPAGAGPVRACGLLVLLDINMPGAFDGVEVLRRIKAHPTARAVPIIMLTTTDDPKEINRCYELGCNVYVTKPGEPAAFIEAIRRLGLMLSIVSAPTDGRRPA